ncbi:MAG: hydroxymethylbilane synthase [Gemmatimonadaceae bacterium]
MTITALETSRRTLRIGTRGSALALVQSEMVASAIRARAPDMTVELVRITTRGDAIQDRPLSSIGGKGLFVTEIENVLRTGAIDLAVHSSKDLPSALAHDMTIGAFLPRADPRDALVSSYHGLAAVPEGACVGTSSPRRQCQLRAIRPDLDIVDIRGNVDTRMRKLDAGSYDALVLACAGLDRLNVRDPRIQPLSTEVMLPAVGQGAIAVELRAGDDDIASIIMPMHDTDTADAVETERAFLAATGGNCNTAVAAYAQVDGDDIVLAALVGAVDGSSVRGRRRGARENGVQIACELAEFLMSSGGDALLSHTTQPR